MCPGISDRDMMIHVLLLQCVSDTVNRPARDTTACNGVDDYKPALVHIIIQKDLL